MRTSDPPFKDGSTHYVEATSDPSDKYQLKLSPSELKGLLGAMLPKGFQLIIYRPESRSKGLDYFSVENIAQGLCINLSVGYYFQDWTYRTNLIYFAEALRAAIEQKVVNCQSARLEKDAYGVDIWCAISLERTDDVYDVYRRTDEAIYALYRNALANADKGFVRELEAATRSDSGTRWWVRYVIVPIVSGGTGAAIVTWVLLHT